jgi:hypothetical protein
MLCIHEAIVGATIAAIVGAIVAPTVIFGRSLRRSKTRAIVGATVAATVGATIAPIHTIPVNQKEVPPIQ